MHRTTLFQFDILSSRYKKSSKQIQLPLIEEDRQSNDINSLLRIQAKRINDQSFINKNNNKTKLYEFCQTLEKFMPATRPQSSYLLLWNLINLFIICYNFIQIPIIIFVANAGRKSRQEILFIKTMQIVSIAGLFIDMFFVRFKIAYYKKEELISRYQQLIPRYLKIQLIFDMIPFLSLIVYLIGTEMHFIYIKLLFYMKLFTLIQINKQMEVKILFSPYWKAFYKFLRMVYFIFFVTSLLACIYFAVDFYQYKQQGFYYQNGYLWLIGSETTDFMDLIQIYKWPVWYIYALYWAVQTSAGVGYGDITPRNNRQVLMCNIVMLTTICMFVIFADTVIGIVNQLQQNNSRRQTTLIDLNYFLKAYKVKVQSQKKLEIYVQSLIRQNEQENQYLQEILSKKLKIQFKLAYQQQYFNNLPILKILTWENQSWNQFSKDLISCIKFINYSKGDFIIKNQITNNFILGLITRGKITVSNKACDYQKNYIEGQYFGQKQFFFGGKTYNQIICQTFTKFFYFQQDIFYNVMKRHQNVQQSFFNYIDPIRFNKQQSSLFRIRCQNCDQPHLLQHCPIFNYQTININKIDYPTQYYLDIRRQSKRKNLVSLKVIHFSFTKLLSYDRVYNYSTYFPLDNLQNQ